MSERHEAKGAIELKLTRLFFVALCSFMMALPIVATAKDIDDYPTVAMLPFQNKAPVRWDRFGDSAMQAGEDVGFELERTGRFEVVEREQLQAILDEHSLNMTGLVDPATAVTIGKLAGADFVAIGSITSLTTKESGGAGFGVGAGGGGVVGGQVHTVAAKVMLRVVDVKTGRIVLYGRGKGHSDSSNWTAGGVNGGGAAMVTIGTVAVSAEQATNAVEKAAADAIYGKDGILAEMDGKGRRR